MSMSMSVFLIDMVSVTLPPICANKHTSNSVTQWSHIFLTSMSMSIFLGWCYRRHVCQYAPIRFAMPCIMAALIAVLAGARLETQSESEELDEIRTRFMSWRKRPWCITMPVLCLCNIGSWSYESQDHGTTDSTQYTQSSSTIQERLNLVLERQPLGIALMGKLAPMLRICQRAASSQVGGSSWDHCLVF